MSPADFKQLTMAEQQEALDAMPEIERKTFLMLTRAPRPVVVEKKKANPTAQGVAILVQIAGVVVMFLLPWLVGVPLGIVCLVAGAVLYRRA